MLLKTSQEFRASDPCTSTEKASIVAENSVLIQVYHIHQPMVKDTFVSVPSTFLEVVKYTQHIARDFRLYPLCIAPIRSLEIGTSYISCDLCSLGVCTTYKRTGLRLQPASPFRHLPTIHPSSAKLYLYPYVSTYRSRVSQSVVPVQSLSEFRLKLPLFANHKGAVSRIRQ